MTFEEILNQAMALLQRQGRVSYRALKRQFDLDEAYVSVRTLVETGVLVGEPGAYRLARSLEGLHVSATVQAVLAARIARLPPEQKRLLQTAAVIGTGVPFALLQAIADLSETALHRSLAHLQTAEFLYETRLFPEPEYTFKHALTHEVAYGSLLLERRRGLHARIVEAFKALAPAPGAEQVERLAYHALRGEVWDKTLVYCREAGNRAAARSAYREAVGYFEQALSALQHLPEQRHMLEQAIALRLALRSMLLASRDMERILGYLHEAEALAEALNDPRRLGQVLLFQAGDCHYRGTYDQAIAACQRALTLATVSQDVGLEMLANLYLAINYYFLGAYRRAIDCFRQAVATHEAARHYERLGLFLPAVVCRDFLAWSYAEIGMFAEGRTCGEEGLQVAEVAEHPASIMFASWGLGLLCLRQGDLPSAIPQLERAMGICHDAVLPALFPRIAAALSEAYALSGRLTDALPLLMQAMAQTTARERDLGGFQTLDHLSLGKVRLLAGHLEEAHTLAERALALAHAHQECGNEAYALCLLGEIAAHHTPPDIVQAEAHYQQALAEELGMRPLVAHCHHGLGMLYASVGQREQARTALTTAIELYRAMDVAFWLPQAEAALALVSGSELAQRGTD